ncbi:LuxR C-terminal-related transcriptional regulator [Streptomyces sp. 4N509B]|uniref:LuxR C-terminal-related transcriptional regulator n=1 Tax=Streptomyces sp. 4N509B TaxID=3457413 RepID=UPI003FCF87FE
MCTTRVPLDVYAEYLVPVGPLSLGPQGDAARLFTERVSPYYRHDVTGNAGRRLVAQICEAVDGIPLAIELAAEAVGSLTLTDLLARLRRGEYQQRRRLRDVPERHRSVGHVLAWGEAALSPQDTELLRKLAVFDSVIDVAAARHVTGLPRDEVVDALRALVHKSLVISVGDGNTGGFAFRVPHLVRWHYRRMLEHDAWALATARERHAGACLAFAREAQQALRWPGGPGAATAAEPDADAEPDAHRGHEADQGAGRVAEEVRARWLAAVRDRLPDLRSAVCHLRMGERPGDALHLLLALGESLLGTEVAPEYVAQLEETIHEAEACHGEEARPLVGEAMLVIAEWAVERGEFTRAWTALVRAGGHTRWRGETTRRRIAALLRQARRRAGEASAVERRRRPEHGEPDGTAGPAGAAHPDDGRAATGRPAGPGAPPGSPVTNGVNGTSGVNGMSGTNGVSGSPGANGRAGTNGVNGVHRHPAGDPSSQAATLTALGSWLLAAAETLRTEPDAAPVPGPVVRRALLVGAEQVAGQELTSRPLGPPPAPAPAQRADRVSRAAPGWEVLTSLLTPRQREVALLVAEGLTNRQIARRLEISEWTVVNHLRQVMRKLRCPSRIHVARVLRHNEE